MSIVVTCATSRIGRAVAEAMVARKAPGLVLADAEPERIRPELRGAAETRQADFSDPPTLPSAFAGAATVLIAGGAEGGLGPSQAQAAIEAARAAGVERIVLLSSIDPRPGNPAPSAGVDRAVEALVRTGAMGWTILRLQEAMEDFAAIGLSQPAGKRMFSNRGHGLSAPIALADAAEAVAATLADPRQAGRVHDLTGPGLVGAADLARLLGIGDVAHKDGKYLDQLLAEGRSLAEARGEVALGRAVREGYYAVASDDVLAMTGKAPLSLAGFLKPGPAVDEPLVLGPLVVSP